MNTAAAQTETRRTEWSLCRGEAWAGSDVDAYRIWQRFDGLTWFQRHEWRMSDGSIQMDAWIHGARGWNERAVPVSKEVAA